MDLLGYVQYDGHTWGMYEVSSGSRHPYGDVPRAVLVSVERSDSDHTRLCRVRWCNERFCHMRMPHILDVTEADPAMGVYGRVPDACVHWMEIQDDGNYEIFKSILGK